MATNPGLICSSVMCSLDQSQPARAREPEGIVDLAACERASMLVAHGHQLRDEFRLIGEGVVVRANVQSIVHESLLRFSPGAIPPG